MSFFLDTTTMLDGDYGSWVYSITASVVIGLSGIFPLLIVPVDGDSDCDRRDGDHAGGSLTLRRLLSFAVGGLLGDVFLHLLPEAWQHLNKDRIASHTDHVFIGLWVLLGIFTFIVLEMLFSQDENENSLMVEPSDKHATFNGIHKQKGDGSPGVQRRKKNFNGEANGYLVNGHQNAHKVAQHSHDRNKKQVVGYLNLVANCIDNFTHGLAVAGSFLVSTKVGVLTTFAILIHEIPHEIGDFAILLRSGFDKWEAAKAQVLTAGVGLLGAITALSVDSFESVGSCVEWILPFTAGGFLNIALVNVLPDLLKEKDLTESVKQMSCLLLGILIMAGMTFLCE